MDEKKKELFEYKLNLLFKELETINVIIDRHDKFTQTTKNWAIVLWIGTISLILKDYKNHEFLNLLFFYSDNSTYILGCRCNLEKNSK